MRGLQERLVACKFRVMLLKRYGRGWISFENEILSSVNKKFYLYSAMWFRLISPSEYGISSISYAFLIDADGRLNGEIVDNEDGGVQFIGLC